MDALLHLVTAEIFVIQVLQPLAQFFIVHFFGHVCRSARGLQDLFFDVAWLTVAESEGKRIAWP